MSVQVIYLKANTHALAFVVEVVFNFETWVREDCRISNSRGTDHFIRDTVPFLSVTTIYSGNRGLFVPAPEAGFEVAVLRAIEYAC